MKKIRYKQGAVATLVLALAAGAGVAILPSARSADAASQTSVALDDDFNALSGLGNWSANSFELVRNNYSLVFGGKQDYQAFAALTKYRISKSCVITYRVTTFGGSGGWCSLQLGKKGPSEATDYTGAMIVSYDNGATRLMDHEDGDRDTMSDASLVSNPFIDYGVLSYHDSDFINVEIKLDKRDSEAENGKDAGGRALYDIGYTVWPAEKEKPSAPSISWEKGVAADGYLAFGGMTDQYVRVYDFKIEEFEGEGFTADFDKNHEKQIGSDATFNWQRKNVDSTQCYIAADTYIDTKDVKAGLLLSRTHLSVDPYCYKQFELTFDIDCAALAKGACYGVGLGLSSSSATADERNFIGIQGGANGAWKFVMAFGGRVRRSSALYQNYPAGVQRFKIEGYYDGSATVTFGGKSETFKEIDLVGNFALGTIGTIASNAKFDNVLLNVTKRIEPKSQAEDRLIDFTGKQTFEEDGYTYKTMYVDGSKWYAGAGVRASRDGGDYIQFADANGASVFGPRNRYEEFICRFSVTVSQNRSIAKNGAKIGVSFGRKAFHTDNASNPVVFFEKTTGGMQMRIYNADCEQSRGGVVALEGMDFWSSEDVSKNPVTYNVMIVVRGGKANVYCAASTAPATEMSVLRAQLTGFESYGFVAAAGRDGATFRLNDFSVVNTAVRR